MTFTGFLKEMPLFVLAWPSGNSSEASVSLRVSILK